MRSIDEFSTTEEYKAYLRFYYAGLIVQSIAQIESQNIQRVKEDNAKLTADKAVLYADELIKILIPDKR